MKQQNTQQPETNIAEVVSKSEAFVTELNKIEREIDINNINRIFFLICTSRKSLTYYNRKKQKKQSKKNKPKKTKEKKC